MFKKEKKSVGQKVQEEAPEPVKTAAQVEAEKVIARGERLKALSDEAAMWRAFATGCRKGRHLWEHISFAYGFDEPPRLSARMDEDTALLWKEFAVRMAEDRERRLREALGV